jgi:hypothetical protein
MSSALPTSCALNLFSNPPRLIKLLDIDLSWRLNRVSDGQRRRVQICMGLLKPYQVRLAAALLCCCACRARLLCTKSAIISL